jgi:ribosome biogenesis GTPase A
MSIHWYPGHMHKASKQIKEALPTVDMIIEILDARIPYSSENPAIKTLRGEKPCLKVLSKSDLADPDITALWLTHLEHERNVKALAISTEHPEKIRQLTDICRKMLPEKEKSAKAIHVMVVGIPNVGKSTLINTLAGRAIAKTGNEPAITKGQQRINLRNGIILSDTPGILWPKVDNENSSYRLATTGAIKDTAMSYDDVAFYALSFLLENYPRLLAKRYQLDPLPANELAFLETVGRQRGCLRSGARVDLEKVSTVFLNEFRAGKIGRITLETPEMAIEEEAKVAIALEEKAKKKEARKNAATNKSGTRKR